MRVRSGSIMTCCCLNSCCKQAIHIYKEKEKRGWIKLYRINNISFVDLIFIILKINLFISDIKTGNYNYKSTKLSKIFTTPKIRQFPLKSSHARVYTNICICKCQARLGLMLSPYINLGFFLMILGIFFFLLMILKK